MIRKIITILLLIAVMTTSVGVPIFADPNEPSAWAKAQVEEAIQLGVVPESIQGNYQQAITREEFASLFVTTAFAYHKNKFPASDGKTFGSHAKTKEELLRNVKVTDYSFTDTTSEDVKVAYIMGLVNGTSKTTFTPDRPVTRQEAAVMLVNYSHLSLLPLYDENEKKILDLNKADTWAKDSLVAAFAESFISGTSGNKLEYPYTVTMDPKGNFTREQAIIVALRIYKKRTFGNMRLRGHVIYTEHALKVEWEVSADKVTAVKFKDGMSLDIYDAIYGMWHHYTLQKYKEATSEQILAGAQSGGYLAYGIASEEMVDAAGRGENAVFDLGFAEYEILNKDYIYQYRFKNNGVYSQDYYGGSKCLPVLKTRLR